MPASLKIPGFERPEGLRFPRRAVVGVVAVVIAVAAGSVLHIYGASQGGSDVPKPPGTSADWAGSPAAADSAPTASESATYGPRKAQLSSADYTSGFDQNAAGLGPLPASKEALRIAQPRDTLLCPDDLNCTFRPAARGAALPSHRSKLIAVDANGTGDVAPDPAKPAPLPQPSGLAMLTANLHLPIPLPNRWPTPNTLLKPFQSVSNTVAGFVKKM